MDSQIKKIDPIHPEPELIKGAAGVIKQGGVIVFPTRCLYGLGADAMDPDAVERIIRIKQRPPDNPILVLIHAEAQLEMLVANIPPAAVAIMAAFWPGRVTLVFDARDKLSDLLTAKTGKIGVRLPGHPVAAAMLQQVKGPITGTSANLSGHAGCSRVADLEPQVAVKLDMILDAGPLKGGIGSTVVDVTSESPIILREGEVKTREIIKAAQT